MKSLLVCATTVGALLTPSAGLMWLSAMQLAAINKTCFSSPALKEPQKIDFIPILGIKTLFKCVLFFSLCRFFSFSEEGDPSLRKMQVEFSHLQGESGAPK